MGAVGPGWGLQAAVPTQVLLISNSKPLVANNSVRKIVYSCLFECKGNNNA